MPHKFNAARRHKFDKVQYRVINWAEYNESLRQRGDLTIWVSEEAQSVWSAPRRTSRGGQRRYSDLAIETCLMLRTAYHLGLRQTQGLMGSIGTLMGLDIRVPDYSTLSRRANGVSIAQVMRQAGSVPIHLVVDSTGLKIFGEGEWLAQKHNTKGIRRRWRKLHLGLDLASGAIVCAALTHDNVGDSTALPSLLDQLDAPVTGFLADGALKAEIRAGRSFYSTIKVVIVPCLRIARFRLLEPPFPSPCMIPDRSSPSRVRCAASRPGPLRADPGDVAVYEGKGMDGLGCRVFPGRACRAEGNLSVLPAA